ncbi:cilia- and flagella-associated protein 47 [Sceloporus undulatus]|uniref:cilia- and flagella-associated protein 47 n=1 Tax=Sceloporus undulatus TaxID=8520 RepID=UPI001C4B2ECC|nr:cilia- and flagella-associated protein 47 [Sceloporus undulatus]
MASPLRTKERGVETPESSLEVAGVRVTPPQLRFVDAEPGGCYRAQLSVQNLQTRSCWLHLSPPQRPQFKLIVENPKKPVASGLHITAMVEYHPDSEEDLQDRLLLHVGKKIIEIPITGLIPCCCLEVEPEINFGTVIANSKVINTEFKITNCGSSPGTFAINYKGSIPITIEPTNGVVKPQAVQVVKMEICTDIPRIINQPAIVELQGQPSVEVMIKANIVEQILELLGVPHSDTIHCVDFGYVYFGTSKTEEVILHNKSPEPMDWVAILQDNAVGTEMGTDIQKSTDAVLKDLHRTDGKSGVDISTLIACFPNEGTLQPYQKIVVTLCFSPKQLKREQDIERVPPRQDYAIFLRFEMVGSKDDFLKAVSSEDIPTKANNPHQIELGLRGSGLPVMLTFIPGPVVNFMECYMGEHTDIVCSLKNECGALPVSYIFRKIAHFNICPEKGKIKPKSTQDVIFSFVPHHVGPFSVKQVVDIIGPVVMKDNLFTLKMQPFHQIQLSFFGHCKSIANKVVLKTNPGLKPLISNATGVFIANKVDQHSDITPVALLKSNRTQIHAHQISRNMSNTIIALPNDRAASIRPAELHKDYRTIFTKVPRYNYVDPEFSYTVYEELENQANKDYYAHYIKSLRQRRFHKKAARIFKILNNPVDIGLNPASGLKSPKVKDLPQEKLDENMTCVSGSNLLTSQQLLETKAKSVEKEVSEGLNPVPSSQQEIEDCSLILTSKQLHQIFIGPSTIDFGEVCVHSSSTRKLHIINNLSVHVWIQVKIKSEELQQTSPLSHVVPPYTKTHIPVVFENDELGNFQKSFTYTINQHHTGHVLVVAKIVPIALELSTREVTLHPAFSFLEESGFRTTITLYNYKNHPAEFTWKPMITEEGTAFSICPEKGTVEACKDLECEVVWHPSFSSPTTGEFSLCVHQGKTLKLKCFAKLGCTSVQFKEQRITFNHAPLYLTTCRTAILQNLGYNHAYFQVLDASPIPGMVIFPVQGVVPVGGLTEIKIHFRPNAIMKFDTRVEVAVRHTKTLELRIGGSVEVPDIDVSVQSFNFPGVYVGSTQGIPFHILNKGKARVMVKMDLANHDAFKLDFTPQPDEYSTTESPCLYSTIIDANSALECSLNFTPKEVAAYDFSLPISVNVGEAPSSSYTKTSLGSSAKHIIVPRPQSLNIPTRICKIQATVLQPPLEVSPLELVFQFSMRTINLGVISDSSNIKKLQLKNISRKEINWRFDLDAAGRAVDDGIFKFSLHSGFLCPGHYTVVTISFCPCCPGEYTAEVPVFLNDEMSVYRTVSLSGALRSPKISFDPQLLILTPVPLSVKTGANVSIIPQNYLRPSVLKAEIPERDPGRDGDDIDDDDEKEKKEINPLTVDFPNGNEIKITEEGENIGFTCTVNFSSSKPLSFLKNLFFVDEEKNRFPLQVSATAENCLLTVYPYLAYHLNDQHIILKSDSTEIIYSTGEALQHPCCIPGAYSQTSSSTFDAITNSAYENSVAELERTLEKEILKMKDSVGHSRRIGSTPEQSLIPAEGTEEYAFFQKVITAVQSWFTLFGWSKGPNPISIPRSLRRDVCKIQMTSSDEKLKLNLGKDIKTIYDMLLHLSGQLLPGISSSQSLPFDPIQRVVQLHWQHATMITFLKGQGASLSHILPEFLLDFEDYKKWTQLQIMVKLDLKVQKYDPDDNYMYILDDYLFEAMSKRAWTDVLLQIYKILVLQRVSSLENNSHRNSEDIENVPKITSDPLSSNIYSSSERILLAWMNRHFEKMRKVVWKECKKGDIPPTRWIVNFDRDLLDGLVLAAQVASYCPYLISTHFVNMYTNPQTSEQYFHNCLILVNAFHAINLDIDILATDVCEPNPVLMLMLCVYLYERLPQYLPKKSVEFPGPLHATVLRKIQIKNPSIKPLVYNASILGRESANFTLPKGNTVTIPPKSQIRVNVEFTSRFLYPAEAILLLVSKPLIGVGGATMTFSLKTKITNVKPVGTLKCKSPCYELKKLSLQVTSPFKTDGPFRVILVESTSCITEPETLDQISRIKQGKIKSTESDILNNTDEVVGLHGFHSQGDNSDTGNGSNCLQEFFSPTDIIFLDRESYTTFDLHYLPFNMGKRYCAIILVNQQIGEFVYLVEGTCGLPVPSYFLPMDSPNVLCISSMLEGRVEKWRGQSEEESVLYLKCCLTDVLQETLKIPLINEAREKALAIAAQQQMSTLEYERRKVTGTLESSSVRVAIAALGLSRVEKDALSNCSNFSEKHIEYTVEVSMPECYEFPEKINIPVLASSRVNYTQPGIKVQQSTEKTEDDAVEVPMMFKPQYPGRYPCHILLQSRYDIRLFTVECVVNTDTAEAELEFVTPAYHAVTQDIPVTNMSQQYWKLEAIIKGCSFYGPSLIYVAPGETTPYTLMYKPTAEGETKGKLILQNKADGTDHVFLLKGIATKPLALDHIKIECQVRQITEKVIMVPNFTKNELKYKVSSDLLIVGGNPTLTVEPGDTAAYTLNISPWKRGELKGVIVFVAEEREQQPHRQKNLPQKTDGVHASQKLPTQELQTGNAANTENYTGSISLLVLLDLSVATINFYYCSEPPLWDGTQRGKVQHAAKCGFRWRYIVHQHHQKKTLSVECTVLDTIVIGIPITNPTVDVLPLDVILIDAAVLSGEKKLVLQPKETFHYEVKYSPAVTGSSNGSVIFLSETFGEFWYALKLKAQKPQPTTMPEVECELGKWVRQYIPLVNPTHEILEVKPLNSNPGHFSMEIDGKTSLIVPPHSTAEVPVQFCPSSLGRTNHTARITFICSQLKEWVFFLSGIGLIPQPMEPACVSSCLGHHSSVIINFKNPTHEDLFVDVILTDQEHVVHHSSASVSHHSSKDSVFWLPLKEKQGIFLPPKSKLDIPVLFAPYSMKLYETVLVVKVVKADHGTWSYDDAIESSKILTSNTVITKDEKILGFNWIYPIHGIPEAPPYKSAPVVVCCQARSRLEERVEVLLTGVVPGASGSNITQDSLTVAPSKSNTIYDGVQVTEGFSTTDEFLYDIEFESETVKSQLKSAVAINLMKKERDFKTGIVTLIFNVVFAPCKPIRNPATLVVQRSAGGIWKFPILFIATEPEVDDVINIEAIGLNKESGIRFRLTSQTRYPDPYTAYFLPGSDPDFVVWPQAGELLPLDTAGTCITVGFKPSMYSKKHKAILVIQTAAMQWMYEINGLPPQTVPPISSAKVDCHLPFMRSTTVQQRNYVRENMKLLSTGVSSTIKGAPLMLRGK